MDNVKITQKRAEALDHIKHTTWWKVNFAMRKNLVKLGLVTFNINSPIPYSLTEAGRKALETWRTTMPDKPQGVWVKFWCHHGPGHQGYDEKYEWYDASELNSRGDPLHWQYDLEEWCDQWDNVSGKCDIVSELPPEVLESEIERAKRKIKIEREWLKLLESMR